MRIGSETSRWKSWMQLGLLAFCTLIVCSDAMMLQFVATDVGADLGTDRFIFVSALFILGECIGLMMAGRMCDIGRRRDAFLCGGVVFLIGTVVCALSESMDLFLLSRMVQGFGAGMVVVVPLAMAGRLFEPGRGRAKAHAMLAAVFGLGLMYGVFFGDFVTSELGWRWCFWIEIPLMLVLVPLSWKIMPRDEPEGRGMDWASLVLGSFMTSDVILYSALYGDEFVFTDLESMAMMAAGVFSAVLLLFHMARTRDPAFPRFHGRRMLPTLYIGLGALGFCIMGSVFMLVLMSMSVFGHSPGETAAIFLWMAVGVGLMSLATIYSNGRVHPKWLMIIGALLSAAGLLFAATMDEGDSVGLFCFHLFVCGIGIGCLMMLLNVTVQNRAETERGGGALGSGMALRTSATFAGMSMFMLIINDTMAGDLTGILPAGVDGTALVLLLSDPEIAAMMGPATSMVLDSFMDGALSAMTVAAVMILATLLIAVFVLILKKLRPKDEDRP